jgi:hypothetical protein
MRWWSVRLVWGEIAVSQVSMSGWLRRLIWLCLTMLCAVSSWTLSHFSLKPLTRGSLSKQLRFASKAKKREVVSSTEDTGAARQAAAFVPTPTANVEAVFHRLVPPPAVSQMDKWIIFSDLHVKSTSIDTCEKVLDRVHAEALQRSAGVIFLGDFWHVRGAVSVDLLNRVLKCFQKWSQPVIMIPGWRTSSCVHRSHHFVV